MAETGAYLTDFKLARNQQIPKLTDTCGKYPTPDGSCSSLMEMFKYTYDTLESRLAAKEICAFYGICTSETTIDTSDPAIPAAPVSPKDTSKVYDDATCYNCNITATVTYLNVGSYAVSMNAGLENNCLSWTKAGMFPTTEEYKHCKDFMGKVFDKLTNTIRDKSNVNYLCSDLFDVCPSNQ